MTEKTVAYRGSIFTYKDSATLDNLPKKKTDSLEHLIFIEDGVLIVKNNIISAMGQYTDLKNQLSDIEVIDYQGKLITPGFIDSHIHSTQSGIIAAYGEKLLEWLSNYVFPAESSYSNTEHARRDLNFFLDQLVKNGTTTACAYGPLFYDACNILFEEVSKRGMRFITGNTIMNHNSPPELSLSAQENYDNSKKLIANWHGKGRIDFCITPRFALSCDAEMLELCGALKKEYPTTYIQTHLNENLNEINAADEMFPGHKHYLDIYDHFSLVTDRSIFGHCIHMQETELERFKSSGAIVSWCPVSNNFLGSGLFDFETFSRYSNKVTLGTDMGGGNGFSMFAVMDDAYKVAMLKSHKLSTMLRWFMATLGSAKALQLDDKIGTLSPGKEADFIVIDPEASEIVKYRSQQVDDIFELLFILMTLGDDRQIHATYINGNCAYQV
jgi:guanine deaminase